MTEDFALWLRVTLRERSLKPKRLADKMGVSAAAVTNWTKGKQAPAMEQLQAMAQVLDLPKEDFVPLCVLAGRLREEDTGVTPLAVPRGRAADMERIEQQIPHLTGEEAGALVAFMESLPKVRNK